DFMLAAIEGGIVIMGLRVRHVVTFVAEFAEFGFLLQPKSGDFGYGWLMECTKTRLNSAAHGRNRRALVAGRRWGSHLSEAVAQIVPAKTGGPRPTLPSSPAGQARAERRLPPRPLAIADPPRLPDPPKHRP